MPQRTRLTAVASKRSDVVPVWGQRTVPLALCRPSPQTLSTLRLPTPVAPPPHFPPRPLSREAAGEVPRSR